jgi:predicted ester cyclase
VRAVPAAGESRDLRALAETVSRSNSAAEALVAPDYVLHTTTGEPTARGPDGRRAFLGGRATAFRDLQAAPVEILVEGDLTVTRSRLTGTQTGPFEGLPATFLPFETREVVFTRWRDGLIAEEWRVFNAYEVLHQVGLFPDPGLGGLFRFGRKIQKLAKESRANGHRPIDPLSPLVRPLVTLPTVSPADRERNRAAFLRVFRDVLNGHDHAAARELLSPDVVFYPVDTPEPVYGIDGFLAFVDGLHVGFPDMDTQVELTVAEGDRAASLVHTTGTNDGPFGPGVATGRRVSFLEIIGARFDERGRGTEIVLELDLIGMIRQLGFIPEPDGGPRDTVAFLTRSVARELRAKLSRS